jgi:hypothetical protein
MRGKLAPAVVIEVDDRVLIVEFEYCPGAEGCVLDAVAGFPGGQE